MKKQLSPDYAKDLKRQILKDYGEWIEQGFTLNEILLSLLHKEREHTKDLKMIIDRLERALYS